MNFKEALAAKRAAYIKDAYREDSVTAETKPIVEQTIGNDFDAGVNAVLDFLLESANDDNGAESTLNHVLEGHELKH